MEIFLIVVIALLSIAGLLGAVLPVLPGPPLSFLGLLLFFLIDSQQVSLPLLVIMGVLMLVITLLDYVAPAWLTRKGGGSKTGSWGAMIGTLVGLFFIPWGVIVGPFLGALVGELIAGTESKNALRVAFYSFIAFLLTTGLKLIYGIVVLLYVVYLILERIF